MEPKPKIECSVCKTLRGESFMYKSVMGLRDVCIHCFEDILGIGGEYDG